MNCTHKEEETASTYIVAASIATHKGEGLVAGLQQWSCSSSGLINGTLTLDE
jgi:hypothetical protein